MLNPELYLREDFFSSPEKKNMRGGFGEGLVCAAEKNKNVVGVTADLCESVGMKEFAQKFSDRFFDVGVAEQNLVTVGAGLGISGKIPFIASYAAFSPGRNWEQIRTTVCYNDANVKIIGSHAGVSVGPDGATHQMTEDIALMRVLPNMQVYSPCDALEAKKITETIAELWGPMYLRLARPATRCITTEKTPFHPGKIELFWTSEKPACVVFATGEMVGDALDAARLLEEEGISIYVANVATVEPCDEKTIFSLIKKTSCGVTVEDHQVAGGLGGMIAECAAKKYPIPIECVGIQKKFGESGTSEEVMKKYGLTTLAIISAVKKSITRKK